jgi:TonB family protein
LEAPLLREAEERTGEEPILTEQALSAPKDVANEELADAVTVPTISTPVATGSAPSLAQSEISKENKADKFDADDIAEQKAKDEVAKKEVTNARAKKTVALNEGLTGKVMDSEEKVPLPGVNVLVKGTNIGTVTDANGQFSLPYQGENVTLVINYIGFNSQEVKVETPKENLSITLQPDQQSLSEVVVTGYGSQANQETPPTQYVPSLPQGGMKELKSHIESNLQYPEAAKKQKVKGIVVIEGTVTPSGDLTNLTVLKPLHPACDQEALRLVRTGPKWQPAKRYGKPVEEKIRVRIRFKG